MLAACLWFIAAFTTLSVVISTATSRADKKPWQIALTLVYGAFVVVILALSAIALQ